MRYELVQLYIKDNEQWLYNYIESRYQGKLKENVYKLCGITFQKEVKKYIKKLLKNT